VIVTCAMEPPEEGGTVTVHALWVGQLVAVVAPLNAAVISPLELRKLPPITMIWSPGCPTAGSSEVMIGFPLARPRVGGTVVVEEGAVVGKDWTEGVGTEPVAGPGELLGRVVGPPAEWIGAEWRAGAALVAVGFAPGPLVSTRSSVTVPIATRRTSAPIDIENRGPEWPATSSSGPGPTGDRKPERPPGESECFVEAKGRAWLSRTRSTAVSMAWRPRVPGVRADRSDP
jgi:hypothetical protein